MPTMPQVLRLVAMSLLDMKEYPAFHEVFHQYVDGIPQELQEELYRELGKDRMKMLAFGSRQAGGSQELVDVLEFPGCLPERISG